MLRNEIYATRETNRSLVAESQLSHIRETAWLIPVEAGLLESDHA